MAITNSCTQSQLIISWLFILKISALCVCLKMLETVLYYMTQWQDEFLAIFFSNTLSSLSKILKNWYSYLLKKLIQTFLKKTLNKYEFKKLINSLLHNDAPCLLESFIYITHQFTHSCIDAYILLQGYKPINELPKSLERTHKHNRHNNSC